MNCIAYVVLFVLVCGVFDMVYDMVCSNIAHGCYKCSYLVWFWMHLDL